MRTIVVVSVIAFVLQAGRSNADAEGDAIRAVEKAGGRVIREGEERGDKKDAAKPADAVRPVVNVIFGSNKPVAGALPHLAAFPKLRALSFPYVPALDDAGAKHLAGLASLEQLSLVGTGLTDKGMKHLAGLERLQRLELASTPVTDAGLEHLAGLKKLRSLGLNATKVTGRGLKNLAGLDDLQEVTLFNTPMTDAGLEHLAALKGLKRLDLTTTGVTEEGVKDLKEKRPALTVRATPVPKALAGIQGDWVLNSLTAAGKSVERPAARAFSVRGKIGSHEPAAGPLLVQFGGGEKAADAGYEGKGGFQVVRRGIYKLDGDVLTICLAASGKDRPTEFASTPGNGAELRVYQRAKK